MTQQQQRDVFRLDGRSALVTGAGSGLGEAIARAFAAAGAAVLVTDIDKDAAVATAESISAAGGTAQPFVLDVRDSAAASEAAAAAAELGGGTLHVLVNNAGAIAPAMFKDLSEENFRRIVDIQKVEVLRHHADNLCCLSIQLDRLANHGCVPAELALPVAIHQHNCLRAAVSIVLPCKSPAQFWSNTQDRQHSICRPHHIHLLRFRHAGHADLAFMAIGTIDRTPPPWNKPSLQTGFPLDEQTHHA